MIRIPGPVISSGSRFKAGAPKAHTLLQHRDAKAGKAHHAALVQKKGQPVIVRRREPAFSSHPINCVDDGGQECVGRRELEES